MHRNRTVLLGLLLLVSAIGRAEEPAPPTPAVPAAAETAPAQAQLKTKEWSVTPFLPAETVFAITVKDVAKTSAGFAKTGLAQLINSPELTKVFAGPLLLARGTLWMTEQRLGYKLNDILSAFQGEVTIAVMGLQEARNEKGEKIPDLLVSFQPREQSAKTMELVNQFVGDLNKQALGQLRVQQSTVAGAEITTLSLPDNPLRLCYTLCNGTFLASLSPGRLEGVLARQQAAAAAEGQAQPQSLRAEPAFQRSWAKVGQNADAIAYFNVEAARKIPEMNLQPRTEQDKRGLTASGLDRIRALTYSLTVQGENIHETLFFDCPAEGRRGLMALLDNEPIAPDALTAMPQNAIVATAWNIDPVAFLNRFIELAGVANPGDAELVEHEIRKLNDELKIDFKKDLLAAFSGQMLFSLSLPAKHPKLGFGFPQPIVRMGVKDPVAAEKALTILRDMGKDVFSYAELPAGERTIVVARARKPRGDDPGQICWVLADHQILMSLFPLALRDELQRMALQTTGGDRSVRNLTLDPQFQSVRTRLGPAHQMLVYMDVSALATAFYDIYVPLAQLNPKIAPPNVDLNSLPPSDFLTRYLGGMVAGVNADAEGLTLESCSATGLWTTLAPMVVIGARAAQRHRRAQALAGRAEPDGAPELARGRQMLREVNTRLMAYAKDHDGNYPATLADLVPNYATAEEAQQAEQVQFLGKQVEPNRVVAHLALEAGPQIPVLLQDGRVRVVSAERLAVTLEKGFVDTPRPATGGGEKPPVPPPDF